MQNDERYTHIIRRHKPRGWRLAYSARRNKLVSDYYSDTLPKGCSVTFADAVGEKRVFRVPYITGPITLHIALHEFAHVTLQHWGVGASVRHQEEFEAEHWALNIMKMEGVPVPRAVRAAIKDYIRDCIENDRKQGIEIRPHVLRFVTPR